MLSGRECQCSEEPRTFRPFVQALGFDKIASGASTGASLDPCYRWVVCSETSVHRLELTLARLVLEVVKCLWLGLDELSPEQRHRARFKLQALRCADATDGAAVIPVLADASEQLALVHKALAGSGCDRSARKVRAVLQSLAERLELEREKVIRFPRASVRP
jgi:hypothetical protein